MIQKALEDAMVTAMTKATEDGYEKAIIESSGNTSLGQLAKEDHP